MSDLPEMDKVLAYVKKALLDTYYAALEGGAESTKDELAALQARNEKLTTQLASQAGDIQRLIDENLTNAAIEQDLRAQLASLATALADRDQAIQELMDADFVEFDSLPELRARFQAFLSPTEAPVFKTESLSKEFEGVLYENLNELLVKDAAPEPEMILVRREDLHLVMAWFDEPNLTEKLGEWWGRLKAALDRAKEGKG